MAGALERTAVLVIRLWKEEDIGRDSMRARITQSLDVSSPVRTETAAASEAEILDAVRVWLRGVTADR
jgi:hypothetical protein